MEFQSEGERYLQEGNVRIVEFSGPTYQIEVLDCESGENFWPFLQFDEQGELKDAFCSCELEEGRCAHLEAALLKIYQDQKDPLHLRFARSLWNRLGFLFGYHLGYETKLLKKRGEGYFSAKNGLAFEIRVRDKKLQKELSQIIEERLPETPENSIKFSNLPQKEIAKWREGRPSQELRYTLSFWSDLARWLMLLQEEGLPYTLSFQEDKEGFPTKLTVKGKGFDLIFSFQKEDLIEIIPTLSTVSSPLKVFRGVEHEIEKITFDPEKRCFHIAHKSKQEPQAKGQKRALGEWSYVPNAGFYSRNGKNSLSRDTIPKEEISLFLDEHAQEIQPYLEGITIHSEKLPLKYEMYFAPDWHWHFSAYLFKKGDLATPPSSLFGTWAFLEKKGFYPVENILFAKAIASLPPEEVSYFINRHRIWLGTQAGFSTHLSSVEMPLTFEVTEKGTLCFQSKLGEAKGEKEFDEWIYYEGEGFFSKKTPRHALSIQPGTKIEARSLGSFIKKHRDELEMVPGFFTSTPSLKGRGLKITLKSATSLLVSPHWDPPSLPLLFFGDYVYEKGKGFSELPPKMRLPQGFEEERLVSQEELPFFFEEVWPHIQSVLIECDSRLRVPHKIDLEVHYLARKPEGGLKAQLFYSTEQGHIPVTEIYEALQKKRRYLFSEGGMLDLQSEQFLWIRHLKAPVYPETKILELTTLELMKIESTEGLLAPLDTGPAATVTRNLLTELREFRLLEKPNLQGLKSELRLYQQTGTNWLWFLFKNGLAGLLCDEMGLGKTHQAMALMAATLNQKEKRPRRYLVVCPTSVIYHWEDKLETFLPGLKVHTFHGVRRSLKRLPKEGLILTSYGILRSEQEKLKKIFFEVAVFDEIQVAKNPHSRVHGALLKVDARMRLGLTGTPIENNLRELKSLFDIVLPHYLPGESRYRELFINPIERDNDEEKKLLLSKMIRPFILRRRKTEVLDELPEKSEDKSYCDLSLQQLELYNKTLEKKQKELVTELRNRDIPVPYVHIFSILSSLKQICDHPALVAKDPKNYKKYESGKWDLFVELLEEARESGYKVVVFSQYLYMLDIIENYLQDRNWGYAQIRGDTINRKEELKRFQSDPNCVVFIGSLQAAGLGIDLTAANVVILYDRWWNLARENQAIDRVHRIGQKWGVQVYKLITKGTIEEKIDRLIAKKGRLMEEIIAADDQASLKKFTRSELIDLLTYTAEKNHPSL